MAIADAPSPPAAQMKKRRPGAASPGPATYNPPPGATSEAKEAALKEAIDEHKQRLITIANVLNLVGKRLDEHDQLLGKVATNDAEMKEKLRLTEDQIVSNDQDLKTNLCTLEARVTAIAQAIEAGATQASGDEVKGRLADLELNVDTSLKGLESAIQQIRLEYVQSDTELFNRFQAGLSETNARMNNSGPAPLQHRPQDQLPLLLPQVRPLPVPRGPRALLTPGQLLQETAHHGPRTSRLTPRTLRVHFPSSRSTTAVERLSTMSEATARRYSRTRLPLPQT